jgi:hypothetical protein
MIAPDEATRVGRLNPIYLEGRSLQLEAPVARALGLRDAQIVQATVELRGETLRMLINGQMFDLPPGLRFRPGEEIWLRAQAKAHGWLLRPVEQQEETAEQSESVFSVAPSPTPTINNSRLLALSLRPPQTPVLMNMFQPAMLDGLLRTINSPELAALFQRMRLSMGALNPGDIEKAVQNSGFWLEAFLAQGKMIPLSDNKSLLRKLLRALSEGDIQQKAKIEKALDDVEAAQVESLAAQTRGEISFSMVLPFVDANPVEIHFFRGARRPGEEKPPFTVNIHTNSDHLGEIWLKTSIARSAHVDMMMWAVREDVVNLARRHTDALSKRLRDAGLTMDSMRIFHSARPSLPESWSAPSGAMLDISV